jgi:hypothetical protein
MDENRAEFIASVAAMRMLLGHLYSNAGDLNWIPPLSRVAACGGKGGVVCDTAAWSPSRS